MTLPSSRVEVRTDLHSRILLVAVPSDQNLRKVLFSFSFDSLCRFERRPNSVLLEVHEVSVRLGVKICSLTNLHLGQVQVKDVLEWNLICVAGCQWIVSHAERQYPHQVRRHRDTAAKDIACQVAYWFNITRFIDVTGYGYNSFQMHVLYNFCH